MKNWKHFVSILIIIILLGILFESCKLREGIIGHSGNAFSETPWPGYSKKVMTPAGQYDALVVPGTSGGTLPPWPVYCTPSTVHTSSPGSCLSYSKTS